MLPIKKSVVKKFDDNNFIYFGIHLSAYTDSKGIIQKKSILPVGWNDWCSKHFAGFSATKALFHQAAVTGQDVALCLGASNGQQPK